MPCLYKESKAANEFTIRISCFLPGMPPSGSNIPDRLTSKSPALCSAAAVPSFESNTPSRNAPTGRPLLGCPDFPNVCASISPTLVCGTGMTAFPPD